MVVKRIDFNLQIWVVIQKGRVAISCTFKFFSHIHDLVLLWSNLGFKIFNAGRKLNVSLRLRINSLLKINILIAVFLFKSLQMIEFILETDDLIFQLYNFTLTLDKLSLFALQIESLGINQLVQVIDSSQLLRNIIFKSSCLGCKVIGFFGLHLILIVQFINFFCILTVPLSKVHQLSFQMLLLGL